jgi:hypothetical protein
MNSLSFTILIAIYLSIDAAAAATVSPVVHPSKMIYPSLILSSTAAETNSSHPILSLAKTWSHPQSIGDPRRFLGVQIRNKADISVVSITVQSLGEDLLFPTTTEFNMVGSPSDLDLYPQIAWNYQRLGSALTARPVNIHYSVSFDGKEAANYTSMATVTPLSVCPFRINEQSAYWTFASYVDEDCPDIQTLITEAANLAKKEGYEVSFNGYQSGSINALRQLAAIWVCLKNRGFTYINTTTLGIESGDVTQQDVLPVATSLANKRGNCVEASTLLASAMTKLGIRSSLVVIPGHMFLAVIEDPNAPGLDGISFVEATLLDNKDDSKSSYTSGINSFVSAIQTGQQTIRNKLRQRWGGNDITGLSIADLRSSGVAPAFSKGTLDVAERTMQERAKQREVARGHMRTRIADIKTNYDSNPKNYDEALVMLDGLIGDASSIGMLMEVRIQRQIIVAHRDAIDKPILEKQMTDLMPLCLAAIEKRDKTQFDLTAAKIKTVAERLRRVPEYESLIEAWKKYERDAAIVAAKQTIEESTEIIRKLPSIDDMAAKDEVTVVGVKDSTVKLRDILPDGPLRQKADLLIARTDRLQKDYTASTDRLAEKLQEVIKSRLRQPEQLGMARRIQIQIEVRRPQDATLNEQGPTLEAALRRFRTNIKNLSASGHHKSAMNDLLSFKKAGGSDPDLDAIALNAIRSAITHARDLRLGVRDQEALELLTIVSQLPLEPIILKEVDDLLKKKR